jgi:hypothetical protein
MPTRPVSLSLLLACVLLAQCASAWTFRMNNEWYPPYSHDGYRPMPHWRIGVWGPDSTPAKASPKHLQPSVSIDVVLRHTKRDYAQFFMYDIERVERNIYYGKDGVHPCMDLNQSIGVAEPNRLGNSTIVITAAAEPDGLIRFSAFKPISVTALYAFTFLTCRFVWQDLNNLTAPPLTEEPANTTGYKRILDPGENDMEIEGSVRVVNPYGDLPGQAYGYFPFYAIIFVVLMIMSLVLAVGIIVAGLQRIVAYHWAIMALSGMTSFVSIFFLAYVVEINDRNSDKSGVYIAAYFFQRVRDALARVLLGCFATGLGVERLRATKKEKGLGALYFFVYILFGVIAIFATEDNGRRVLAVASVVDLSPGPMSIAVIILDLTINLVIVVVAVVMGRKTWKRLEKGTARRRLYFATVIIIGCYVAVAFLNSAANVIAGELHDRPYEINWEIWWFQTAFADLIFVFGLLALIVIWFPRNATLNITGTSFADESDYNGIRRESRAPGSPAVPRDAQAFAGSSSFNAAHPGVSAPPPAYAGISKPSAQRPMPTARVDYGEDAGYEMEAMRPDSAAATQDTTGFLAAPATAQDDAGFYDDGGFTVGGRRGRGASAQVAYQI